MARMWQVFWFELKRQATRRGYLFMTFGVPLIAIALLFGYQAIQSLNTPDEEVAEEDEFAEYDWESGLVGYVDHSGLFQEQGLFASYLLLYDTGEAAEAALADGDIQTYYVIATDYLESGDVTRYVPSFGFDNVISDSFFQRFVVETLLDDADQDISSRLRQPLNLTENRVIANGDVAEAQSDGASFVLVYLFSFLLLFGTFFTSGYLMQSVVEEKETRMVEILLSTMRPWVLLAGKVLSLGLLGFFQIGVWLVAAIVLLSQMGAIFPDLGEIGVRPDALLWTLVYFGFGYMFFAAAYAAIGAIAPSMREGPQLAIFVTLPAALPFYFTGIIAELPNGSLATIMSLFPLTAPLTMVQRLAIVPVPLEQLLLSVGLLALTGIGMTWLAGRVFRVNVLLAGQMPRFRDLLRIIQEK